MSARLLLAALAPSFLGSACGGGDDEASPDTTTAADRSASDSSGDSTDDDDGGSPDVDCAAITEATQGLGLALQILAQLRTLDQYALVKDGTLVLDPAATLEDIDTLRALEGVEIQAGFGSVKETLDTYEEAATLAQGNLAVNDPFADAKGDELAALTEDVAGFLGGQVALGFALDAASCT